MKNTGSDKLQERLETIYAAYNGEQKELIPILQDIQDAVSYLPEEAISATAAFLNMPDSTVYGVVTFYSQFHLKPQGKHKIKICEGTACHVRGAKKLAEAAEKKLGIKYGETTKDGEFSIDRVACVGSCALAPAIIVNNKINGPVGPEKLGLIIDKLKMSTK